MRTILISAIFGVAIFYLPVFATIINVPDDYSTIQQGIDASVNGDTVLVQPGTYVENINFNGHNIVLGSLFLTTSDTSYISQTVIDGNAVGSVVTVENGEIITTIITGFTIQNGFKVGVGGGIYVGNSSLQILSNNISNNVSTGIWEGWGEGGGIGLINSSADIKDNTITINSSSYGGGVSCNNTANVIIKNNNIIQNIAEGYGIPGQASGGGIYCRDTEAIIENNNIKENIGGGISCEYSDAEIYCNAITENSLLYGGAGISCIVASSLIINNVISENIAEFSGGGIYCQYSSNAVLKNTLVWSNHAQIYSNIFVDTSSNLTITYSDINDTLWPGEGNTSIDPLFRDPENGDFHLMAIACDDPYDSPCIDMGHPDILDGLLDCGWGLGNERSDMGAYGGGDSAQVEIDNLEELIPTRFFLSQNYPNPFNSSTVIKYDLPRQSHVTIEIYDILGRKIHTLAEGIRPSGNYQATWDASGQSSGIYIYKLQAGGYIETEKMLLLK